MARRLRTSRATDFASCAVTHPRPFIIAVAFETGVKIVARCVDQIRPPTLPAYSREQFALLRELLLGLFYIHGSPFSVAI